ncbi:hypothetical protein PC129_g12511 [Phytophthora cactorum]|uniref:EF-hand domain-containing protein n=2 Tax=Phytophthora cactorum TaxID=29920 RepID=A0A329RTI3_9STRA|nr:hypothetical protein PC113_g13985 [Phytophthora cactorum]KAG3007639.1 hypothetical protein PC119_g14501 [Phytophthora cactorum]KAG3156533.1 hypothetical protein C6341_g15035 [Phytophthora cactorum]KAG3178167.1 hypothetical protein PC128_g16511 [Phytophthora cactorum]KAG3216643.1 hypothetical protein PC129_g12511 [Phytophthora cactorum]
MELATMQDMDTDFLNFDAFFAPNNDEGVEDLWNLAVTSAIGHDDDLLDVAELEPLSPILKEEPHEELNQVQVKQEPANKLGLKIDTKLVNNSKESLLSQYETAKANGTPTATLPARFALLSTTCVYEPGFTTSPRGKRRISQTHAPPIEVQHDEEDDEDDEEGDGEGQEGEAEAANGDDEPFILSGDDDYMLPAFTDAEFSAMVESPSKFSNASTSSAAPSPLRGLDDAVPHDFPGPNSSTTDAGDLMNEQEIPDVINMFNSIFESSQNFLAAQEPVFDLTGTPNSNCTVPAHVLAASQAMFSGAPVLPFNIATAAPAVPFDYFSPSGYAAAANQFLDSYGHQIQPFFLNPDAVAVNANSQLAAAMAMANTAAMNTMLKMNASYGVPIAPMDRRAGSMPPPAQIKVAAPIKPRLPVQRAVSASSASAAGSKVTRMAITPDIADFKLVQIFHQFCDPVTKVLNLPRFQQLLLHHQVKEDTPGATESKHSTDGTPNGNVVVTPDAQTLFNALDINGVGVLDLERFMHSFQICNRCTEAKRRAHQALCASQGQTFTPTALEKQLMEDVAPVVVRVVPTRFEGHKVKSCEHYQWTWCEGFEKTGNEKCRGTNRHDKCPKYLANCTLWKHKLPPKSRKPKLLIENVDSPTKKLKHFS